MCRNVAAARICNDPEGAEADILLIGAGLDRRGHSIEGLARCRSHGRMRRGDIDSEDREMRGTIYANVANRGGLKEDHRELEERADSRDMMQVHY